MYVTINFGKRNLFDKIIILRNKQLKISNIYTTIAKLIEYQFTDIFMVLLSLLSTV